MASKPVANLIFNSILRRSKIISPSILRPYPLLPRTLQPAARRYAHAIPKPPGYPKTPAEQQRARKLSEPHYQLTFTCVPCGHRSAHEVSKIGYHHGSVLISCPSCRNRHIISDHLNIFGDRKITVEDLMREKGQLVKRGSLGEDGDIEFWQEKEEFNVDDSPAQTRSAPVSNGEATELDDTLKEEEDWEAATSRETRDPSSQSTDPKPKASGSLGDAGARPSIGGSHHANPVLSTRRQYTTTMQPTSFKPGVTGRDFLKATIEDEASFSKLFKLSEQYIRGPRPAQLRRALRRALSAHRSTLTRIPKEEMLSKVNKVYAETSDGDANAGSQAQGTSGETVDQTSPETAPRDNRISAPAWPRKRATPVSEHFYGVRYHRSNPLRDTIRLKESPKVASTKEPTTRRPVIQDRFNGVRFYDFYTVDSRPQYIRTGDGPLYKRRRPTPWTGQLEEEEEGEQTANAKKDTEWLDLDIPFQWKVPEDVPDGSDRTVYPTTARSWPNPRTPSYTSVHQGDRDGGGKIHFYEAMAVRRAEKRSREEKSLVPVPKTNIQPSFSREEYYV
ncbi:DNL zinc finger-domain-containing protein [Annulohypoxylon moriforme]|nr:DNL zinc finger-domain-containing protein [Annulohypoxylon moriforme]